MKIEGLGTSGRDLQLENRATTRQDGEMSEAGGLGSLASSSAEGITE